MEEKRELIKCERCKNIKPKELINIIFLCCNKCIIIETLKNYLLHARIANYFNLSIEELNNIMIRDMEDPTRDELGKHERYDEITEYHCWKLLEFLYDSKKLTWTNPITKKELNRNSDVIISFLSKCYYVWGDLDIIFNGEKLTYKEHIERFIDKKYLFDVRKLNISPAIVVTKPKSNSPAGKPPAAKLSNRPGSTDLLNARRPHHMSP
jgi:hypothetical protein